MASLKSTRFFAESAGASTFACKTALFPEKPFPFLSLSIFFSLPVLFLSCSCCFLFLLFFFAFPFPFRFSILVLSFSFPFPFLFLSYFFYPVSFLFLCFSVPFPSLPLHFLSFPPRAQAYHRCEHFTESTLKEYYSQHSKWGIAIWEGPIANLSFLHFLKTNVQPIHILVFASFDDCSYIYIYIR